MRESPDPPAGPCGVGTVVRVPARLRAAWSVVIAAALVAAPGPATAAAPAPAPAAAACRGAEAPPAPPAEAERATVVAPLPVPPDPVGGPALKGCGDILPQGVATPSVAAAAWVLADLDTGAVLAAHAPHARHRPASALKILTALVALRRLNPDLIVEGTADDLRIEGSKAGIGPGGRYTVRQLLAGLLLSSGNDAAAALSRAVGGEAGMLAAMQATARELGALDTRPATPSGLDGPGMSSSAYDLALLFRVAAREPLFLATLDAEGIDFPGYGDRPGFRLSNESVFRARYPGALGGKTGFTDAARHTLVAAAQRDGRRLVVALLGGEQQPEPMWRQAAALLDLGFALPAGTPPVGVLVDAAPAAPARPEPAAAPGPAGDAPDLPVLAVIGLGVVLGGVGSVLLARRRRS